MQAFQVSKVFGADHVCGVLMVTVKPFSFLGDVAVDSAEIRGVGRVADSILVTPAIVGSTVGPYILYALSRRGTAPRALITKSIDPTLVAGCVVANVSLYRLLGGDSDLDVLRLLSGAEACVSEGMLIVRR